MNLKSQFLYKRYFLGIIFLLSVLNNNAQQLLYPTFSNFSIEATIGDVFFSSTSGETITGVKNGNGFVFIEGLYALGDFTSDTLAPQVYGCRVFPNPSNGRFTILNESNNFSIKVDILNLSGIIVKSLLVPANSTIDVSNFMSGTYLVHINDYKNIKYSGTCVKLIVIN
jgi:hypothetical protein